MTARRVISVMTVGLCAGLAMMSAIAATVAAQPRTAQATKPTTKKAPKGQTGKKGPLAPAKDSSAAGSSSGSAAASGSAAGAGSAGGGEGSSVQMTEDPPPSDMSGTAENPDAPRSMLDAEAPVVTVVAAPPRPPGFPIEAVLRGITLPQNMSEVSVMPHLVASPFASSTALRARYGITPKLQLGLTYLVGGIFDDPSTVESKQAFHSGKAVGLDVTYMIQDWIGVQVGVPIYISPLAVSLTIGAPVKFAFGDKFAVGGLDDFLNIRLDRFAPTFYQELQNATNANNTMTNTIKSAGELRVSVYGLYQYQPNFAIIGRIGIQMEDFATGKTDGCRDECLTTFLSAGLLYSPRRYLDLGLQIGFDDLAHGGSFAPAGFLAFRI